MIKFLFILLISLVSIKSIALTTKEFFQICASTEVEHCDQVPILQAYIGGGLDLLSVLDEQTNYLQKIYCTGPESLFDVSKVMKFMKEHEQKYASENAMRVFIRYFEERGGCKDAI